MAQEVYFCLTQHMRILFIFTLLSFATLGSKAQNSKITFGANWHEGLEMKYKVFTMERKMMDGKETYMGDSMIVGFTVLTKLEDGYILEYRVKEILTDSTGVDAMVLDIRETLMNTVYRFKTNTAGEFGALTNWEEVRGENLKLLEKMKGTTSTKSDAQDIKVALTSQEQIEAKFIEDVGYILEPLGKEYLLNQTMNHTIETTDFMRMGLSTAIAVNTTTKQIDQGGYKLESRGTIPSTELKQLTEDFFERIKLKASGRTYSEAMKDTEISMDFTSGHFILSDYGIIVQALEKKIMKIRVGARENEVETYKLATLIR